MAFVTHTMIDHSGELSFTRHYLPAINAGNYATITGNTPVTQNVGSLRVALGAITDANFVRHEVTCQEPLKPATLPVNPQAQREVKLLVRYVSSAARRGSFEIPAPNLTLIGQPGTDQVDTSVAEWINLVTAVQANCVDSYGDTIAITDGRIVGRSL